MFERARSEQQIQERKNEIISACEKLYFESGYEDVHFKAISAMTSFTRSSIYNYYRTKDEILLDVLSENIKDLQKEIIRKIDREMDKTTLAGKMTGMLSGKVKMLNLFSIVFTMLENNSRLEKTVEFKKVIIGLFKTVVESIGNALPKATEEQVRVFATAFFSYVMGLYALSHHSEKQLQALKMADMDYEPPNFETMCYQGTLLLMSDLPQ